ncbi:MAG: hypothetical protein HY582_05665 [Candidatus Omnitrophica bacterium]|nr:hypothetical protein [Candidatus Omnitrophota bacterium]
MKKSAQVIGVGLLLLLTVSVGCASRQTPPVSSSKNIPPAQNSTLDQYARTDTSLGAFAAKKKVESEEQAEALISGDEAKNAFGELHKKEMQEELQKIQLSIVEFDKNEEQVRQQE